MGGSMLRGWAWMAAGLLVQTAAAGPGLSLGVATGAPSSTIVLDVVFAADGQTAGLQFDLRFDTNALSAPDSLAGPSLGSHLLFQASPSSGVFRTLIYSPSNAPLASGSIVTVHFDVEDTASNGVFVVTIDDYTGGNAAATSVPPSVVSNGYVQVGEPEPPDLDGDGDGLPDWWETLRGLNPAESNSPTANADEDEFKDWEEYIADTNPTNPLSSFPAVGLAPAPAGRLTLVIDPTSTARVYEVRWTTNLLASPQSWPLYAPAKPGTGTNVMFSVTNDAPGRIYRTGVRLP